MLLKKYDKEMKEIDFQIKNCQEDFKMDMYEIKE